MKQFYLALAMSAFAATSAIAADEGVNVIWTPQCVADGHSYEYQFEVAMRGFTRVGLTDVNIDATDGTRAYFVMNTMGDDIYIQNPLPRTCIGSYIKGMLTETEDEMISVECQLPQYINANESGSIAVSLATKVVNPDGMIFFEPVKTAEENVLRYMMNEDEDYEVNLPEGMALATFYCDADGNMDNAVFSGAALYSAEYKDVDGRRQPLTLPANLESQEWGMIYSNDIRVHGVTVAIDEENGKFYVAGFSPKFPESVVVGDIDGDKITFAGAQYIGCEKYTYNYLVFNKAEFISSSDRGDVYDFPGSPLASIEATYDKEAKQISCPMDIAWFNNIGTSQLYYDGYFVGPMFVESVPGAATPVDPEITEVMDFMPEFGYGGFMFDLPLFGTDGEILYKENYIYVVYFDGEPYTFMPGLFPDLTEPMTEIPYDFEDGEAEDFRVEGTSHIVCWRTGGFSSVGVQGIYTYDGEVRKSNVVTYQLAGVETVCAEPVSVDFYDVAGKKVVNPENGLYIKVITFDNGKKLSSKVALGK